MLMGGSDAITICPPPPTMYIVFINRNSLHWLSLLQFILLKWLQLIFINQITLWLFNNCIHDSELNLLSYYPSWNVLTNHLFSAQFFLVCNSQIEATINNLNQTKDKFTPVPDKVSSRSPTRLKKISKFKEARTAEVSSRNFVFFSLSTFDCPS